MKLKKRKRKAPPLASIVHVRLAGEAYDVVTLSPAPRDLHLMLLREQTGVRDLRRYVTEPEEEFRRRVELALARTRTAAAVIATQLARPGESWDEEFAAGLTYLIRRSHVSEDVAVINQLLARAVHELLTGELLPWSAA
jgi:hypothetical protein